jgi:hypothetical protein
MNQDEINAVKTVFDHPKLNWGYIENELDLALNISACLYSIKDTEYKKKVLADLENLFIQVWDWEEGKLTSQVEKFNRDVTMLYHALN